MILILWSLFGFLIAITLLVAVHEYGHFLVARLAGIEVLRFSIGFGKPLFSFLDKKGTQYALGWIPFGGYVKLLDEYSAKESTHAGIAFSQASLPKRMAVLIAGPLFNFLFAILAYTLMLMIGINSMAPVIGEVNPVSIAAKAQLHPLQEITAINDTATPSWEAVQMALLPYIGNNAKAIVATQQIQKPFLKQTHQLDLTQWSYRGQEPDLLPSLGITPYAPPIPPIIASVLADGPAAKAGFQPGDKIIRVAHEPIHDWRQVISLVSTSANKTIDVTVVRHQQQKIYSVTLGQRTLENGRVVGYFGVVSSAISWPLALMRTERAGPWHALIAGTKKTWQMSRLTCKMLAKMVMGKMSTHSLSGPLGIAQGAGVSAEMGLSYYLSFLALISISLGIVNLLPIPLLDGGQLLFCLLEAIKGNPLSKKAQAIGFALGIVLLGSVFVLAIYNDIIRL